MNSKQIYSRYFDDLKLTESQLEQLHKKELEILADFKLVCEKYNLHYMLSGGSVLGAIRHKGFIPWDDDIDLMMYRKDYDKLDEAFKETFGDKYIVKSNENDKKFVGKMKKIYLKNTKFVELEKENYPEENCLFVDVFAIDNIPEGKIARKIRGAIHDFAFLATGAIYCFRYPSATILKKAETEKDVRTFYNKKRLIGAVLSMFFGFRFYMYIEKKLANYKKESKLEGIPTGIRYNREVFGRGFFKEVTYVEFEGEKYPIPARYDEYLKNLYGDYMSIPPIEKREIHPVTEFEF